MTHAALPLGLVAGGVDLTRSDGRLLFQPTRGLNDVPEVRGIDTIVPGLPGRVPRDRVLDRLVVEAEGMVIGAGSTESAQRTDFRALVDDIRALMDPTQSPYDIVITVEDGSSRTITARPVNVVWGPADLPSYRTASLQWEGVDATDWTFDGGS